MRNTFDQTGDPSGAQFLELSTLYGVVPDFVKQATLEDVLEPKIEPGIHSANIFADTVSLQFPIHSPAATWTSYRHFLHNKSAMDASDRDRIRRSLDYHVGVHEIGDSIEELKNAVEGIQVKIASDSELTDDDFAYVHVKSANEKIRKLPIATAKQVVKSAETLRSTVGLIPYEFRREMATRILEKRASTCTLLRPDLVSFLEKQAGLGVPTPSELMKSLKSEANKIAAKNPDIAEGLCNIAENLRKHANLFYNSEVMSKLVDTLYDVEAQVGLDKEYDNGFPRPEERVYSVGISEAKMAAEYTAKTPTGEIYDVRQLLALDRETIDDIFGPSTFKNDAFPTMAKLAAAVKNAPPEVTDRLAASLLMHGITPVFDAGQDLPSLDEMMLASISG